MVILKSLLRLITFFLYKNGLSSVIEKQKMSRNDRRVLVQMNSGIGDAILSLPLIHELKRKGFEVYALTNQNTNTLGELCPDIQKSIILDYRITNIINTFRVICSLNKLKIMHFIGTLPSNRVRDFFLPIILRIPTRVKHISPRIEKYQNYDFLFGGTIPVDIHENNVESNLMLLHLLNEEVDPKERKFYISLPARLIEDVKEKLKKWGYCDEKFVVGIHPGCKETWSFKRWPAEKFANLINVMTRQSDLQVILFGGPDEENLTQLILRKTKIKHLNLIGKLSLKETVCAISFCAMFISNDSGLMHIATMFDIPVIGLFGARSNEVLVGPYGSQHIVIKKSDVKNITVGEVYKAVNRLLTNKKVCLKTVQSVQVH